MSSLSHQVMQTYRELVDEINQDVDRLRKEYGGVPCPSDCFKCCLNTSTIPISEVEARDLKVGLDALCQFVTIYDKRHKILSRFWKLKDFLQMRWSKIPVWKQSRLLKGNHAVSVQCSLEESVQYMSIDLLYVACGVIQLIMVVNWLVVKKPSLDNAETTNL